MTTTQITYGKKMTAIQANTKTNVNRIVTFKVSEMDKFIKDLECFAIRLNKSVLTKTINRVKALGFMVEVDENQGFDWEVKMYCYI